MSYTEELGVWQDTDERNFVDVARDLWGADVVFEVWVEHQQEQDSYKACPTDSGQAWALTQFFLFPFWKKIIDLPGGY